MNDEVGACIAVSDALGRPGPSSFLSSKLSFVVLLSEMRRSLVALLWGLGALGLCAAREVTVRILSVSDIHGWIYGHKHDPSLSDVGGLLSYLERRRAEVDELNAASRARGGANGSALVFVTAGDEVDGTGLSSLSSPPGAHIYEFMSRLPVSLATVGNHDLGYAELCDYLHESAEDLYSGRYVTTNTFLQDGGLPLARSYRHETLENGLRVLMLGLMYSPTEWANTYTEPAADVLARPEYDSVFDELAPATDVVLVAAHISSSSEEVSQARDAIRARFAAHGGDPRVPILFVTAHSHRLVSGYCEEEEEVGGSVADGAESGWNWSSAPSASAPQCYMVEAGCYLQHLQDHLYTFELGDEGARLVSVQPVEGTSLVEERMAGCFGLAPEDFMTPAGAQLRADVQARVAELGLSSPMGCSNRDYSRSKDASEGDSLFNLWLHAAFPAVAFNAERPCSPFPAVGPSSLRDDIHAGEIVLDDCINVQPFANKIMYVPGLSESALRCVMRAVNGEPFSGEGEGVISSEKMAALREELRAALRAVHGFQDLQSRQGHQGRQGTRGAWDTLDLDLDNAPGIHDPARLLAAVRLARAVARGPDARRGSWLDALQRLAIRRDALPNFIPYSDYEALEAGCYDLLVSEYDMPTFEAMFGPGQPCEEYGEQFAEWYPSQPHPNLTTDMLLQHFVREGMPCGAREPRVESPGSRTYPAVRVAAEVLTVIAFAGLVAILGSLGFLTSACSRVPAASAGER